MSVEREDPYLRKLRREAKDIKKASGCSQAEALRMVAAKLGFSRWELLVKAHMRTKEQK